jgi:hypothetical protein
MPPIDPMTVTEVTLGEVYRLMLAQGQTLTGISASLEKRPTWDDVNRLEAARAGRESIQNQAIKDLEDGNKWLVRAVIGAALGALAAIGGVLFNASRFLG